MSSALLCATCAKEISRDDPNNPVTSCWVTDTVCHDCGMKELSEAVDEPKKNGCDVEIIHWVTPRFVGDRNDP